MYSELYSALKVALETQGARMKKAKVNGREVRFIETSFVAISVKPELRAVQILADAIEAEVQWSREADFIAALFRLPLFVQELKGLAFSPEVEIRLQRNIAAYTDYDKPPELAIRAVPKTEGSLEALLRRVEGL